jgi:DNA-binding transcriptional LysR family regulator
MDGTPLPQDVQLPHLQTFSRAAELASFTRAAESLCVTQAAVSQHIRGLERELGVALFHRHGGRVVLTDAGRRLYDYAQRILALHAEARREIGRGTAEVTGELRLGASTVPAEHFLPKLLAEFRALHPRIHIHADVADSEAVLAMVPQGKAALALVGTRLPASWAEYRAFASDRLTLIFPADHRWSGRAEVTLDELRQEPLVMREKGSGTRACFERALATQGMSLADLRVSLELGSNEAIKDAVLRSLGVAVLSVQVVNADLASGKLREALIERLDLTRELYVVFDSRGILPPPARAFLAFLATQSVTECSS